VYTVIFTDGNGLVLKVEQVQSGGDATPPTIPSRGNFTFDGWLGDYTNVTSNRTITAKWLDPGPTTIHTVTFIAGGNTYTQQVIHNGTADPFAAGVPAETETHEWVWDAPLTGITGPVTINGTWQEKQRETYYTVRFLDGPNGNDIIPPQQVIAGGDAVDPYATPIHPTDSSNYCFAGWDRTFNNITSDITVVAKWYNIYGEIEHHVVFLNAAGTEWDTQMVEHGDDVEMTKLPIGGPTKTGFVFDGWEGAPDSLQNITAAKEITPK
jgi:hypothetical protein